MYTHETRGLYEILGSVRGWLLPPVCLYTYIGALPTTQNVIRISNNAGLLAPSLTFSDYVLYGFISRLSL